MGRYNNFDAPVRCSGCDRLETVCFQARIGILDLSDFVPGDVVWGRAHNMRRPVIGPDSQAVGRDVWAYGLGSCPSCTAELWAVVEVRDGRFARLELTPEPENPYDWGQLIPS